VWNEARLFAVIFSIIPLEAKRYSDHIRIDPTYILPASFIPIALNWEKGNYNTSARKIIQAVGYFLSNLLCDIYKNYHNFL